MENLVPFGVYRHYKGNCYEVVGFAKHSETLEDMVIYKALYGKEPKVMAIHAGLECGIIGTNYPKLDMISLGPTIRYPHSPDEKVEIASVGKFYDFLVDTLKNAPKK